MAHSIYRSNRRLKGKYFIYAHLRVDKCSLFYIGLGTKQGNCKSTHYQRAFAKRGRNPYWKNIVAKTEYKVIILFETDNLKEAKNKEICYINKYKDKVCNISIGGDFPSNLFLNKKKVYQYSLNGDFIKEWECLADIYRELGFTSSILSRCLLKLRKSNNAFGFQWFYENQGLNVNPISLGRTTTQKGVILYSNTEKYTFNSRKECAKFINRSEGRVTDLIKIGTWKHYKIENNGPN